MALVLKCNCGKLLDIDEQHHGERGQCPWCGNQFTVGEVISSTTAVQTEAIASKLVTPESQTEKRRYPNDVVADPKIALPKAIHPLGWLLALGGALCVLLALAFFQIRPMRGDIRTDQATTIIETLSEACKAYKLHLGKYPMNLEEMTVPNGFGGPHLSPDFRVDPWGRPYHYDPAGPRNNGLVPDIWCVRPDGTEIGNWPKGR